MNKIIVGKSINKEYYDKNGKMIRTKDFKLKLIYEDDFYLHMNSGFEKLTYVIAADIKNPKTNIKDIENSEIGKFLDSNGIKGTLNINSSTIILVNSPEKDKFINKQKYLSKSKVEQGNLNNSPFLNFYKLKTIIEHMEIEDERDYKDSYLTKIKEREDQEKIEREDQEKIEIENLKILEIKQKKQKEATEKLNNLIEFDLNDEFNFI